jgi:predicted Zn-dependent protease
MNKINIFQNKVANSPDNLLFRFSLGQALYEAGRGSEAIEHLERCAASRDDWMLPRILLGKALLEAGQPERARPILEAALELAVAQHHDDPAAELRDLLAG